MSVAPASDAQHLYSGVCGSAYANNQWRLDTEIGGGTLAETSFAKAMDLAIGTVSVVDSGGVSLSLFVPCLVFLFFSPFADTNAGTSGR